MPQTFPTLPSAFNIIFIFCKLPSKHETLTPTLSSYSTSAKYNTSRGKIMQANILQLFSFPTCPVYKLLYSHNIFVFPCQRCSESTSGFPSLTTALVTHERDLKNLEKNVTITVMVYDSKILLIRFSKGKRWIVQSAGRIICKLPVVWSLRTNTKGT